MTPRELVYATLEHRNTGRAPRQLWELPWAEAHYPQELDAVHKQFPNDIVGAPVVLAQQPKTIGNMYEVGTFVDEWGCTFQNIHPGVIGEVKASIIPTGDDDWDSAPQIHIPTEWITFDVATVNDFCAGTDRFVTCGACPRPFEQLQFIRGTENLYMDLMDPPPKMLAFMDAMHAFYCELLTKWAQTDVDALNFMDDWGSQNSLLISPALWVRYFKPMYKDYIDIAHRHGKKIFMHSDGYTLDIYPHLVELGLDAINSQLFCMGIEKLAPFKGKITFWGEIDRQGLLPSGTEEEIREAVRKVHSTLWQQGGCIAQLEFGPGAKPQNVWAAFDEWNNITV